MTQLNITYLNYVCQFSSVGSTSALDTLLRPVLMQGIPTEKEGIFSFSVPPYHHGRSLPSVYLVYLLGEYVTTTPQFCRHCCYQLNQTVADYKNVGYIRSG